MPARILILEDDRASLELFDYLLKAHGHTTFCAVNGSIGLQLARTTQPDLIICDLQMPVMDGFEVVQEVRSDPLLRAIPMVALTAFSMVGDRERVMEAGFDFYLAKPIDPHRFAEEIAAFLPGHLAGEAPREIPAAAQPSPPAIVARGPGRTILVVDDRPANRQFLLTLLGYMGHDLLEASDGAAALALMRGHRPDLVITDILMPGMNGYQLVQRLRADPAFTATPVIFYTATFRAPQARALAESCGVEIVLPKPSEPQAILDAVNSLLGLPGNSSAPPPAPAGPADPRPLLQIHETLLPYNDELRSLHAMFEGVRQSATGDPGGRAAFEALLAKFSRNMDSVRRLGGRLTAMLEIALDMRAELGPQHVIDRFCHAARELTHARYAAIGIVVEPSQPGAATQLLRSSTRGLPVSLYAPGDVPTALQQLAGALISGPKPVRVRTGADPAKLLAGLPNEHPPVSSLLGHRIGSHHDVIGWIYVADKIDADGFLDEDERIIGTLAPMLALLHENATMHDLLQRHAAELQLEIQQRRRAEAEIRRRDQQMAEAQKMEAIGRLSSGVAHDFNNLLSVIVGNLELLAERLSANTTASELVAEAHAASLRGAALTRQMLAFSRRLDLVPEIVDPARVVEDVRRLLRLSAHPDIDMRIAAPDGLGRIRVDPAQLDSAIVNLVLNAQDAMPEGGVLTVHVYHRHHFGDSPAAPAPRLTADAAEPWSDYVVPGEYIAIAVSDTGTGMTPQTMSRAFEPFFTTKPVGKGTGLGLSMVLGFAKQSGGHVSIVSEPEVGTTVTLEFPIAAGGPTEEVIPARNVVLPDSDLPRGTERILLVDDDHQVASMVKRRLENFGYTVTIATSPAAALQALAESVPDLLLTDLVMPGTMDGRTLARRARAAHPGLKIVFMSGMADARLDSDTLDSFEARLLSKPFRKAELAAVIRAALDSD